MKKALLIIFISVIIGSICFAVYKFLPLFSVKKTSVKSPFDRYLSYESHDLMMEFLRKLGYDITVQQYGYSMDLYSCIAVSDWNKFNFSRIGGWLGKGKRLIVFFDSGSDYGKGGSKEIETGQQNQFLNGVKKVIIYGGRESLDTGEIYRAPGMTSIIPVLSDGRDILIAGASCNGGDIVFVLDDTLFSDRNILKSGNAVLLNNIFRDYYHKTIVFDQSKNIAEPAGGKFEPEIFLFKDGFPYLLAQLFLIAVIFFAVNFKRFGNILDYDLYKKRSLSYHISAVSNFYLNSGKPEIAAGILDDYFFERIARYFPGAGFEEMKADLLKRYGNRFSADIFERGGKAGTALKEKQRMKFINLMEKGEKNGKRF